MDSEEEKVLYLTRVGRDKIFKYGTYNMVTERAITQDHPFYEMRDVTPVKVSYVAPGTEMPSALPQGVESAAQAESTETPAESPPPPPPPEEEPNPEALAAQVISSNFKVGLSQEEVDALLNGMN